MKKTFIATALAVWMASTGAQAQLVINELMQSNIDCIMDDLNDFPDSWVELYNSGDAAVNLSAYKLGDKEKASKAWQLPNKTVGAGQYAIVYCDKAATDMHTSFRLESGKGCNVYLFKDNEIVDKVEGLKKQPAPNIAYGRTTDGAADWAYQLKPTPGAANSGKTCSDKDILGEPVFSMPGAVYSSAGSYKLKVSLPENAPEGTVVRYTTDGTEPNKRSNPFPADGLTISSSTVIRATCFCTGWLSPRSTTHSYIFHGRKQTIPIISIVTNQKYFYDDKLGVYVEGNYNGQKKNYEYNWRRPVNIELFDEEGKPSVINQLGETRCHGGASRGNKFKSLAVYANKRFGEKRFKYELFPEDRPGITDHKSFVLRNAGNDFDYLYMRDAVIQRTMAHNCDLDWQAYRPAVVYLNGEYLCMLNIRDRSNEDNIYTYYDGLEDIDMVENNQELKAGSMDSFKEFTDFYNEHGHTLAEYAERMDIVEYQNLMAMNLFYNNQDFPGNNIVMWKPQAEGGRWRWIVKDTDFGMGLYNSNFYKTYKTLDWLHDPNYDKDRNWGANSYEATRLFRRLEEIDEFKQMFIDRCAVYMGDFMNYNGTNKYLTEMSNAISTEYPIHRARINQWWPNYDNELKDARSFLQERESFFYKHLADYYKLGAPQPLSVNQRNSPAESAALSVTVNGIPLTKGTMSGKFFKDRQLTIEAKPTDDSKAVTGWRVMVVKGTGQEEKIYHGETLTLTMPECTSLLADAIITDITDGITSPTTLIPATGTTRYYNMQGQDMTNQPLRPGLYIMKQGGTSKKVIIR